jgi:3-hydroxyacyl-[acyl-carrier-protein] dehydratase
MAESHRASFIVPADHPALPGHFPGTPVVPGVVVLDHVLKAAENWQRTSLHARGLKQVKFHSPLLPDQRADVSLELGAGTLTFRVSRGDQPVAQGTFTVAVSPPAVVPSA